MGYWDGSRLLAIRFCQPHVCFLDFVGIREYSVVVSRMEIYIP